MSKLRRFAGCLILFGNLLLAQDPDPILIKILEGSGAVVPRNATSSRRITVCITDTAARPVQGLTVTFRLPNEGPSGQFPSGLTAESMMTNQDGKASVYGIHWNDMPGRLEMRVTASSGARRAEAAIPIEISPSMAATRADRTPAARVKGPSSSTKWWIIGGAAAGALVSLAAIRQPQAPAAAAYTVPAPAKVPPTIGVPVISVGRP